MLFGNISGKIVLFRRLLIHVCGTGGNPCRRYVFRSGFFIESSIVKRFPLAGYYKRYPRNPFRGFNYRSTRFRGTRRYSLFLCDFTLVYGCARLVCGRKFIVEIKLFLSVVDASRVRELFCKSYRGTNVAPYSVRLSFFRA